jgi:L-asparaginase
MFFYIFEFFRFLDLLNFLNLRSNSVIKDLLVLTTGGTLDKVYFDAKSHYQIGEPAVIAILKAMNLAVNISFQEICKKDSLEINSDDRAQLGHAILASNTSHILITHGTDTMIETAKFLNNVLLEKCANKTDKTDKLIVLTGAMQPAAFRETDAIFNIGTALGVLSCATQGIYIAMNGQAFKADSVFKNYETRRFEALSNDPI